MFAKSAVLPTMLRKFDMADRDRSKGNFLVQLSPLDSLSFMAAFAFGYDDFKDSGFGVTGNDHWDASIDAFYTPSSDLSYFINYTHEEFDWDIHSRQRGGGQATHPKTIGRAIRMMSWIQSALDCRQP
jgi:hypothetical protein